MVGWWEWANVERHEDGSARLHQKGWRLDDGVGGVAKEGYLDEEWRGCHQKVREGGSVGIVRIVGKVHMYKEDWPKRMARNSVAGMYRLDWRDDDRVGDVAKWVNRDERMRGRMWEVPGRGGARKVRIVLLAGHGVGGLEV